MSCILLSVELRVAMCGSSRQTFRLCLFVCVYRFSRPASLGQPMAWSKMSQTELRVAKKRYVEDGETTAAMAERLGWDQTTVTRWLVKRKVGKTQGRPRLSQIGTIL